MGDSGGNTRRGDRRKRKQSGNGLLLIARMILLVMLTSCIRNIKAELEEIVKPSRPRYSGGIFYPGNLYHVEEEELLLWSKTSLKAPLILQGYVRYQELFEKYVGSEVKDIAT